MAPKQDFCTMPKGLPLPPHGAKSLDQLPRFALAQMHGGDLDAVVRALYAAVEDAGGRPSGRGATLCRFTIGTVQASVDLSTGWATASAEPKPARRRGRGSAKALLGVVADAFEPDFEIDPTLQHAGFVWTIDVLPDFGDGRIYEINAAVMILREVGRKFRLAVVEIFQAGTVNLFVRMSATSGFETVYPDAVADCCLDWAGMRLYLSDGRKAEQALFTPALGQAMRLAGDGQPLAGDVELCRRIGKTVLNAFPKRAWGASTLIELMRELAPSVSARSCKRIVAELKQALPETSPWRTGARPPALALREAAWPILEREGIIPRKGVAPPDDDDGRSR